MIILGLNNENNLIYVYTEDKSKVSQLIDAIKSNRIYNCEFYKDYVVIIRERESGKYYFFYDEYKNVKDAKHATKVLLQAVFKTFDINTLNQNSYNESEHIILHNAKNIVHKITSGLRSQLNYDELVYQDDKVKYINKLVSNNPLNYSRELLRVEKALEQVSFEYNCLDLITSGELLDSTDRTQERIHSCLVQSFYIYENDFNDRRIRVEISKNQNSIFCNFFSVRSAFALLFENCLKYCKEGTDVNISIDAQRDGSIKIDIDMVSIYNSDEEMNIIFLEHERGAEAKKKDSGKGLGLFLVTRLLEINGFSISMKKIQGTDIYDSEKIHYCRNLFIIDIPAKFVMKEK